ncbi:MAG: DUF4276 family protein [Candidatus Cloacimonetes bacterium]|nr:DUF4276 family protein [Candidatus Cloacimonadota bacterium]
MSCVVFFLEEESARAFLEKFIPRFFPQSYEYIYITFEGKQDMERQLPRKLKLWQRRDTLFVILRDQDSGDCKAIKEKLSEICQRVEKPECVIRIACRELESWYLGDLASVGSAYEIDKLARQQNKKKFRNPDTLGNPDIELKKLTNGLYQKVSGSRLLGSLLRVSGNKSHSFNIFVIGVRNLCR